VAPDELAAAVEAIRWYHRIDLGHGIVTPGVDETDWRLRSLALPESLHGKTVLDVGAWDGFFSFEAERRGGEVLATDSFCWSGQGGGSKAGFELARRTLGSDVRDLHIDVLELSPERVGRFDVVLFLGVLYHMRHPLLALERAASVTRELLVVETLVDLLQLEQPALAFYPGAEVNNDPTNWFGPNPPAVIEMLHSLGFDEVRVVPPPFAQEAWPELPTALPPDAHEAWFGGAGRSRLAFHARR
jgi:tRNA (mo5U34)-methyltransferase